METYEIYWSHLSEEAKEEFKDLYHENIELTPLAIINIESTDEFGDYEIQKIDDVVGFANDNNLDFYPPQLESDQEAWGIFNSLTHNQLEGL